VKLFLSIAAVLAWLFGLGLLLAPAGFYRPTGIPFTPMLGTIAQAHGATLVGLGTIDWLARGADRRGVVAVLTGNLVVQVLSLAVVLRTAALGAGAAVTPGVAIHVLLGLGFAWFLKRAPRAAA
jgi:hypothetical protein